jgi:hypothetical protein
MAILRIPRHLLTQTFRPSSLIPIPVGPWQRVCLVRGVRAGVLLRQREGAERLTRRKRFEPLPLLLLGAETRYGLSHQ